MWLPPGKGILVFKLLIIDRPRQPNKQIVPAHSSVVGAYPWKCRCRIIEIHVERLKYGRLLQYLLFLLPTNGFCFFVFSLQHFCFFEVPLFVWATHTSCATAENGWDFWWATIFSYYSVPLTWPKKSLLFTPSDILFYSDIHQPENLKIQHMRPYEFFPHFFST